MCTVSRGNTHAEKNADVSRVEGKKRQTTLEDLIPRAARHRLELGRLGLAQARGPQHRLAAARAAWLGLGLGLVRARMSVRVRVRVRG